jgi:hypothetical protein
MPTVLTGSYEYADRLDAPVWSHSRLEATFVLFYTLRELATLLVALLVKCAEMDETLCPVGCHRALKDEDKGRVSTDDGREGKKVEGKW